jgi:hypothetical protein
MTPTDRRQALMRQQQAEARALEMEQHQTTNDTSYTIAITRHADGGRATIEWDGYGMLHELLTDIMAEATKYGWLVEWPELPTIREAKTEGT